MMAVMFCAAHLIPALNCHAETSFCWEMSPEKSLPASKWLQSLGKSSGWPEWHLGKSCRGTLGTQHYKIQRLYIQCHHIQHHSLHPQPHEMLLKIPSTARAKGPRAGNSGFSLPLLWLGRSRAIPRDYLSRFSAHPSFFPRTSRMDPCPKA